MGAGAHVGRAPDPSLLPAGFQPVTVAGDEVSRVHWELVTGPDGALAVRNLSRTTVTRLRPPGWYGTTVASDDGPTAILPGTTVHFGSRWAVVER